MPRPNTDQPNALDMFSSIKAMIMDRIGGVRVGQVVSYDQVQRVAIVQPVRRRSIFGTPQQLPTVTAPVGWWRFGSMVFLGEVQPGDEVLLVTCEREIWPWYMGGQIHDPTSERMHDASDSIALPWVSSVARAITARTPGTFWMGREDGQAGVTFTQAPAPGWTTIEGTGPASIALGSAAASPVVLHVAYSAAWATLAGALSTISGVLVAVPPASDPVTVITMANANNAAVEGALVAFAAFAGTVAGMASVKTVAE